MTGFQPVVVDGDLRRAALFDDAVGPVPELVDNSIGTCPVRRQLPDLPAFHCLLPEPDSVTCSEHVLYDSNIVPQFAPLVGSDAGLSEQLIGPCKGIL